MGTTNSKKLSTSEFNEPTNLTPLQNAVLYKKVTEVRQLLSESDGLAEESESGPSLLHLALAHNPPGQVRLDRLYEYLAENNLTGRGCRLIRETVELLCSRGARLEKDSFKMNPLEAVHYCSKDKNSSRVLVNIMTSYASLACTDLIRYSVCRIVYHRCERLIHQTPRLINMRCCNSEGVKDLSHSLLLFVKHGIEPGYIPGKLTPVHTPGFYMHYAIHDIPKGGKFLNSNIDFGSGTFDFLEYKLATWQRLWNLSDPLNYTFHPWMVGVILSNLKGNDDQREKSRYMLEILITTWLQTPPYSYTRLSRDVLSITRHLMSYMFSVTKKTDLEGVVDVTKLNQLLHLLVDVMSVMDSDLSDGVKMGQLIGYNIHKLLIRKYEDFHNIPYCEVELLSKSISKLFTLASHSLSYLDPLRDYKRYDGELDRQEFLGFLARFDPDLNARSASSGRTPLHDALLFGNIYLIQVLMESGANPFTVDREGNSFIEQLGKIIKSLRIGPARELYQETRDQYIILNPPFPLFTLAANAITRGKIPFDVISHQPRLYNMLLSYLPP